MSKQTDEDDEENEFFHESLDRLLSSSSCSCSASNSDYDSDPTSCGSSPPISSAAAHDPEADGGLRRRHRRNPFPVPKFPMAASRLDVWISAPASVSERRSRLLREMGLNRDPILSRVKPETDSSEKEFGVSDISRSVSSSQLNRRDHGEGLGSVGGAGVSCVVRSKSDGSASGNDHDRRYKLCNPYSCCSCSHSINHIRSHAETSRRTGPAYVNCDCVNHIDDGDQVSLVGGSVAAGSAMACLKTGENLDNSLGLHGNSACDSCCVLRNPSVGEVNEEVNESEQVRTIKNLDNGKEFVVNEIREDGTCKKLREVGTGRQLTLEEFEMCVGHSPIVQELMRRQNVEDADKNSVNSKENEDDGNLSKFKKKGSWLKSIKSVASSVTGHKDRRSSDDRDTSSEKGGRRSSSATDDSQDSSFHGPEKVRVRQYGKSCKELTALYKTQEIQAHNGSIWSIKFSCDGRYLASAGEDCVIRIWQVVEAEKKGELLLDKPELLLLANGSPEPTTMSPRRKGRTSLSRKSFSLENIVIPDTVFGLSDKPFCSFQGHLDDVLDLSWSKSQHLLSSSMDKTVRLWHLSCQTCLKVFSHSDYVTCIQFNPVDDRYFISGSLDAKVRIWSIPDRQVVDWYDLHEMVTAACYTPDGQGALVGSYKGNCRVYNTSDKLQQKNQINLQNRKKKAHQKKITGFQFIPGSSSEVLVTSSDSRIRVVDDADLIWKFKGFRNTNSQIAASLTADGRYVVAASEDSHVYIWKYEPTTRPSRSSKAVTTTTSYEHFHSQDVSVAVPWPGMVMTPEPWDDQDGTAFGDNTNGLDEVSTANHPPTPVNEMGTDDHDACLNSPHNGIISSATNGYFFDRISVTWPEEKPLFARRQSSPRVSTDMSNGMVSSTTMPAWGMVIVTASLGGEIRTFQNFGLPIRI